MAEESTRFVLIEKSPLLITIVSSMVYVRYGLEYYNMLPGNLSSGYIPFFCDEVFKVRKCSKQEFDYAFKSFIKNKKMDLEILNLKHPMFDYKNYYIVIDSFVSICKHKEYYKNSFLKKEDTKLISWNDNYI